MCDLHPNCSGVALLAPAAELPAAEPAPLPPGFLALAADEYAKTVRQCPIERYYDVSDVPISMGQWASVFKCRLRSTGAEFAAKFCNKLRMGLYAHQEILHEVAALRQCRRCPRIVQLYEVFETEDQYILVMEFGRGGDLQAVLDDNQVPYENDVIRFMRNLLEGLVFIHERNIAHLDIKPQNLVLTGEFPDCDIKLCDLEISRVITADTEVREMLGTPDYVAPEILRFDPVTLTSDIWSVGVLAYVLLTGFTPFGGDTDSETFRNIARAELDFPDELFEDVSELARDFIRRCLVKEPKGRLSARQSLMHPWLQQTEPPVRAPSEHGSNQSILSNGDGFGSTDSVRTLRRSVSKSREVLCEKVSNSQLKKNISKSRERLCDLKFGLSKSRERMPRALLAGGVSRSSEVLSGRPPWRAAGVNCPLGKPLPPPMERMGSFKVRDQYQSQVVAGLGSSQSLNGVGSPFVRHCSLRGRKKPPAQASDPPDFRASLRRNKKNMSRRNSLQMDGRLEREEERAREARRRSQSTRDEQDEPARPERRRDSRRELSLPPDDGKNMIIVEIISDGEEEDVFTRLYRDRLKDSELKWRKLRDSDFERDDDEKENNASHRSELAVRRPRVERSRSRESAGSRGSKAGSDETLVDRLNTLPPGGPPPTDPLRPLRPRPSETESLRDNGPCWADADSKQRRPPAPAPEPQKPAVETERRPTPPSGPARAQRRPPERRAEPARDAATSPERAASTATESSRSGADTAAEPRPPAGQSMEHSPERPQEAAPWRRPADGSPQRWRRTASSSPEPGAEPRRRRPGSATAERSVNTDVVATRDRGINTDAVLVAAVVDEAALWERAQALGSERARECAAMEPPPPAGAEPALPVATLRGAFERQVREHGTPPRDTVRQTSAPPAPTAAAGAPLAKSSTDEDVRRRVETDEKRSVAFAETATGGGGGGYRRSSSLSSDLGSSELSSDAGSESYCVVAWEAAAAPAGERDQATELKPVVTTRLVGRPRSQSTQMAQLELARLRQRGRSHSVTTEPFNAAQPWGPLCSGSVARAFEKFHSMAGDPRKRRQSSPNIAALGAKVSDMGRV